MRYIVIVFGLCVLLMAVRFARRPKPIPLKPEPFDFVAHDETGEDDPEC